MRVSFFGKGGSGKTTMSAAFIEHLANKDERVLAIDADVNVHLASALGVEAKPISGSLDEIKVYLEGPNKPVIGTTPPTRNSRFIYVSDNDEFLARYSIKRDNVRLLTVGSYEDKDVGSACYHGKLNTVELVYHRLMDGDKDFVVADSTAGVDSVGTSMFFVSDVNVFVVEPTRKSVKVFEDFERISADYKTRNYVIANKINDLEDERFLSSRISSDKIIGFIPTSLHMRRLEQGDESAMQGFVSDNAAVFNKLSELMQSMHRDWEHYYDLLKKVYLASAEEWYNEYYGDDLSKYIDKEFSYKEVEQNA